jgi:hypothetical protein
MIDLGVAQVLVGQIAQVVHRLLHAEASAPNAAQHPGHFLCGQIPKLRPMSALNRQLARETD